MDRIANETDAVGGMTREDPRFDVALYTMQDLSRYLRLPRQTVAYWAKPHSGMPPVVTMMSRAGGRNQPVVPFVGFTEAFVASVFRRVHGLSWPYIRKALARVQQEMGLEHALASRQLYTDGAKILFDHGQREAETRLLVEVVSDNVVFTEVVEDYLRRIEYARDGWAKHIVLPTTRPVAAVTPYKAHGQALTIHGEARIVDILDRFEGEESFEEIAEDFGVPRRDVEEVIRAFYKAA
ncbi:MAG: hypothetical protein ABJB55_02260 [Actinomycetota bacterium]